MALFDQESWEPDRKADLLIHGLFGKTSEDGGKKGMTKATKKKRNKHDKDKNTSCHEAMGSASKKVKKRTMKDLDKDGDEKKPFKKHKKSPSPSSNLPVELQEKKGNIINNSEKSTSTVSDAKKRKRKRKKKNNSKKNKYKHLALNSKKTTDQSDSHDLVLIGDTKKNPLIKNESVSAFVVSDHTDSTNDGENLSRRKKKKMKRSLECGENQQVKNEPVSAFIVSDSRSDGEKLVRRKKKMKRSSECEEHSAEIKASVFTEEKQNNKLKKKSLKKGIIQPEKFCKDNTLLDTGINDAVTSVKEKHHVNRNSEAPVCDQQKLKKRKLSRLAHNNEVGNDEKVECLQIETKVKKKKKKITSSGKVTESDMNKKLKKHKKTHKKDVLLDENVKSSNMNQHPFSIEHLQTLLKENSSRPSNKAKKQCNDKSDKKPREPQNLGEKMQERLNAAHFRFLNEQLYTQTGKEALDLFTGDREAFDIYHEGFKSQVAKWPVSPVDQVIKYIEERPSQLKVVDFGCGDAKVARSVSNVVYSYDLVAVNDHVQVCDISKVPLANSAVDIGVFCLSLMGTNLNDFLAEANRVLKTGGTLLVAEVVSRFEKVGIFVRKMEKIGFSLQHKDDSNKMFIWFEFKKMGPFNKDKMPDFKLSPCIYKKR